MINRKKIPAYFLLFLALLSMVPGIPLAFYTAQGLQWPVWLSIIGAVLTFGTSLFAKFSKFKKRILSEKLERRYEDFVERAKSLLDCDFVLAKSMNEYLHYNHFENKFYSSSAGNPGKLPVVVIENEPLASQLKKSGFEIQEYKKVHPWESRINLFLKCLLVPILIIQCLYAGLFAYFGLFKLLSSTALVSCVAAGCGLLTACINYYFLKGSYLININKFSYWITHLEWASFEIGKIGGFISVLLGAITHAAFYAFYGVVAHTTLGIPLDYVSIFNIGSAASAFIINLVSTCASNQNFLTRGVQGINHLFSPTYAKETNKSSVFNFKNISGYLCGIADAMLTAAGSISVTQLLLATLLGVSGIGLIKAFAIVCAVNYASTYFAFRIHDQSIPRYSDFVDRICPSCSPQPRKLSQLDAVALTEIVQGTPLSVNVQPGAQPLLSPT